MSSALTVNIAAHLPRMAKAQPQQVAIHCPVRRDATGQMTYSQITYAQLEAYSNRIASGLMASGVKRGDRVALLVPPDSGKAFFALVFALFKVGAVMICVDPGIGTKNMGKCLTQAKPSVFIGIPKAQIARKLLGWARKTVKLPITVGSWPGLTLNKVIARGQDGPQMADTQADETAAILFTSGSTGIPKGVVYSHGNFVAQVDALIKGFDIKPGEVDLCTFPLFALYAPAMGMTAVVPVMDFTRPGSVDPKNIIDPIEAFKVNNMFGSPALLKQVGEYGKREEIKLHSLHRVISAGAPVRASVMRTFKTMLNPATQIFTPYGATECLPVAIMGSDEILKHTAKATDEGKGVCVGKPVPSVEVRIIRILDGPVDVWSDDILADEHTVGEICVKAPQATASYFQLEQATTLAKIKDGQGGFWHRMGDLGYLDEDGRLWFCGRKSQRVHNKHGVFFTICCEGVFNTHPKV
ncbi:MAG: fatty acid CoA ligase family protein, partial [Phycisphaeraceae bacterium JB051]